MEHTNYFNKGLTSDVNIVLQPDGTYRYMKNCSLISQDGNNYVIKDCLGNVKIFTINAPYDEDFNTVGPLPIPICFISFPNKIIVLSTNSEGEANGYGEIGIINYLPYGEGIQPDILSGQYNPGYTPLYHSANLNFSKLHRAEGFGYEENELIARIYWTDNFNEPRVFNVSDPIFTNYIASGSIINGTSYMILEGAITYNGQDYGPGMAAGNIFTATATSTYTNLTGTSPTPKVVVNYPYQLLNFTPSRSLGTISFVQYGSGGLFCGNKMYFYRLGRNGVPSTTWSYGSSMIHVGTQNDQYPTTVSYQNFVGGGTETVLMNSGNSVFVKITNLDTNFDFVELACAEFDQLATVPRQISIVNRVDITGATMTIQHTGTTNLGILTLGDITLFPASILRCKTIATNKNYDLIANITERAELEVDFSGVTASELFYPMNVHSDADSCGLSGMIPSGFSPVCGSNPASGTVTPFSRYLVTAGTAIYNGNPYTVGKVIIGVTGAGNNSIDTTTNPGTQVRPCVTRNNYTASGVRRENAIEITGAQNVGFWDYKEPTVHHHVQGYWGGETYRFGILFFDLKGNPFYVRHLTDFAFASSNADGLLRADAIGNTGELIYSLNAKGITLSNIVLPPRVVNNISGFSIVRAERDARVITQGVVTQCADLGTSPKTYEATAWLPASDSLNQIAEKVYAYLSPDLLVNAPLPSNVGLLGDTMEVSSWIEAYDYGSDVRVRGAGAASGPEQVYSKLLTPAQGDHTPIKSSTITFWADVVEDQTITGMPGGASYANIMNTTASALDINGACVPGGNYQFVAQHTAIGSKKTIFTLTDDFFAYNSVNTYTSGPGSLTPQKTLMNYVKTGFSNPYGGTGDSALANTLYISTGHFQPITNQFKADTFNGTNYVLNQVEIFGGDCFTCLVDIGYGLWDKDFPAPYSYAWTFPCECNANYNLRRGRKTSNSEMYYTGGATAQSLIFLGPSSEIRLEQYSYNPGYTAGTQLVHYPALPVNFINANQFKSRIRFSREKFIGEVDDSFRQFALLDYKDLSVQNGRINNLLVKDDKVIVLQDLAVNTVPILERQQTVSESGDLVNIGTGGVVDRFDIISSYFGNQHQWSVVETEYGFAWFDMHRKGVVILGLDGSGMFEASLVNGLQGFFNEIFLETIGVAVDEDILLNSPTFADTSDRPLVGIGITSGFDPKFKMTYLTFKFKANDGSGLMTKDFTIGYLQDQLDKFFVGFYDMLPVIYHTHNQWMFSVNNPKNTTQYLPVNITGKSFIVGETLQGQTSSGSFVNTEYICIQNVTLDNVAKYPLGASGGLYWTEINSTNELWFQNQPVNLAQTVAGDYLYDSFFGRIVDNEVQIVINPKDENPFSVLKIEQEGNNTNFTDIYTSSSYQSASDLGIKPWNRFYRVIYDKVTSTLPVSSTGRITDSYLLIRFVKKNWTTLPTLLDKPVKIFRWLKSFCEPKR